MAQLVKTGYTVIEFLESDGELRHHICRRRPRGNGWILSPRVLRVDILEEDSYLIHTGFPQPIYVKDYDDMLIPDPSIVDLYRHKAEEAAILYYDDWLNQLSKYTGETA